MSFITNSKALRLGFTSRWDNQHISYSFKDYHLSFTIRNYILGLLKDISRHGLVHDKFIKDSLIKERLDNYEFMKWETESKGTKFLEIFNLCGNVSHVPNFVEKRISNFIPGQVLIHRRSEFILVKIFCYFDLLNATVYFEDRLEFFWGKLFLQLTKWLGGSIDIFIYNTFYFFWSFNVYFDFPYIYVNFSVKNKVARLRFYLRSGWHIEREKFYPFNLYFRTYFLRFKRKYGRHRYFQSTAHVILMLFIFPFDPQLLATIIAQELGRLRQYHKIYLRFLQKTLKYGFNMLGKVTLRGLLVSINGGLTLFRRRMTRTSKLNFFFGDYRRSLLGVSGGFGRDTAMNRFGSIGIVVHVLYKPLLHWERSRIDKLNSLNSSFFRLFFSGFINKNSLLSNQIFYKNKKQQLLVEDLDFDAIWNLVLNGYKKTINAYSIKKSPFSLNYRKTINFYYPAFFSKSCFKSPFIWLF